MAKATTFPKARSCTSGRSTTRGPRPRRWPRRRASETTNPSASARREYPARGAPCATIARPSQVGTPMNEPTRTTTALLEGLEDAANAPAWQAFDQRYRPLLIGLARRLGLTDDD